MPTIRRPIIIFFALSYAWSWAWWLPIVITLRSEGITDLTTAPSWMLICALVGGYGPTVAAVVMTVRAGAKGGLKALFSRFTLWRAPATVHIFIWLGPPAFIGIAMLLAADNTALLGDPEWTRLKLIPLAVLAALPFGPLGEELGWRGYALPALQKHHSALVSSLIIGVFWCFWHAPLF